MTCPLGHLGRYAAVKSTDDLLMRITDFECTTAVQFEYDLLARLEKIRRGDFGAFELTHAEDYPMLSIHFNLDVAYLHYCPNENHPGFQSDRATPEQCSGDYHFLQTNNCEADSFEMSSFCLADAETAYLVAVDFFHSPTLPKSIDWLEL